MHASSAVSVTLATLLLVVGGTLLAGCGSEDPSPEREVPQPDPAAALIVPAEGIAGVEIGDELAAVEDTLGTADSTEESSNEANGQPQTTLTYDDPDLRVILGGNGDVRQVETEDEQYRTSEGSGVGSTIDELRADHPDVECLDDAPQLCGLAGSGTTSTDFFVEDGEVVRVVVSRLED